MTYIQRNFSFAERVDGIYEVDFFNVDVPVVTVDRVEHIGDVDVVQVGPAFRMEHRRRQSELKIGVRTGITKPRVYKDLSNHFTLLSDLLHGSRQSRIVVLASLMYIHNI